MHIPLGLFHFFEYAITALILIVLATENVTNY